MKAHRVRSGNRRGGSASQMSHPKPNPTQQPYKTRRTPPIVRILQYPRRSGVIGGRHTAERNPDAHRSVANATASDANSKAVLRQVVAGSYESAGRQRQEFLAAR